MGRLITGYRKALQSAQIYIDQRETTVNVSLDAGAVEEIWKRYVDPVFRKLGVDDDVMEKAAGIVDAEFREVGTA